jgi:hypothetical protein
MLVNLREVAMNELASTVRPHGDRAVILGRTPSCSSSWRRAPIRKIAGVLTVVITAAFVTYTILPSKFAVDATIKSNAAERGAAHVVVDGLFIAIPNNLAHFTIEDVIALP